MCMHDEAEVHSRAARPVVSRRRRDRSDRIDPSLDAAVPDVAWFCRGGAVRCGGEL